MPLPFYRYLHHTGVTLVLICTSSLTWPFPGMHMQLCIARYSVGYGERQRRLYDILSSPAAICRRVKASSLIKEPESATRVAAGLLGGRGVVGYLMQTMFPKGFPGCIVAVPASATGVWNFVIHIYRSICRLVHLSLPDDAHRLCNPHGMFVGHIGRRKATLQHMGAKHLIGRNCDFLFFYCSHWLIIAFTCGN